jgi:DNA-binding protein YbaB
MTTLQEYLNQKYPTQSEKEQVKEIDNEKINQELEEAGENNLLEGGSLDLTGFKNLEKIKIDPQFLKTALDRLYVKDLVNLEDIF